MKLRFEIDAPGYEPFDSKLDDGREKRLEAVRLLRAALLQDDFDFSEVEEPRLAGEKATRRGKEGRREAK